MIMVFPRKVAWVFGTRIAEPTWPVFMCERENRPNL